MMLSTLLSTHEALAVEVMHSVFGVPSAFKLDETKAGHNAAVNDTAVAVEEFLDVLRACIWRESWVSVSLVSNCREKRCVLPR